MPRQKFLHEPVIRLTRDAAAARRGLLIAAVLATAASAAPASAHHSAAMFDPTKSVTIEGTVKAWDWTNPHSWLRVVVQTGGTPTDWSIEFGSPNNLYRQGLRPKSLKPGDKVTVTFAPLRDGSAGGQIRSLILPDGKPFKQGGV